jgi:hypothetical protein
VDCNKFSIYTIIYRLPEAAPVVDDDDEPAAETPTTEEAITTGEAITTEEAITTGSGIEEPTTDSGMGGEDIDDNDTPMTDLDGDDDDEETSDDDDEFGRDNTNTGRHADNDPKPNDSETTDDDDDNNQGKDPNAGKTDEPDKPDDPVKLDEPGEDIPDDPTPQIPFIEEGTWAIVNLLLAIGAAITAVFAGVFRCNDYPEDRGRALTEEEKKRIKKQNNKRAALTAGAIAIGMASIATFFLTEDMSLKAAMVDKWTILMTAYLAGGMGMTALARKKNNDGENGK